MAKPLFKLKREAGRTCADMFGLAVRQQQIRHPGKSRDDGVGVRSAANRS
ncbi:MAG TPA: hypothetical protein PK808_06750 [Polymorphobacter sp.]|nr:hypothetical protein [Polymorphobacter sp.]